VLLFLNFTPDFSTSWQGKLRIPSRRLWWTSPRSVRFYTISLAASRVNWAFKVVEGIGLAGAKAWELSESSWTGIFLCLPIKPAFPLLRLCA
jgi:hypothetical protein